MRGWPRRNQAIFGGAVMAATIVPTSGLAPVNGIELAYQIHGRGRPLVLLHGGFGSVEMFGPNVAALAAGRQVIGVDLQSHGRTPTADRPMRFETMADDIAALIRYLGHEQADVMGFSLGGGVALRTAIQHPESVRKLVVVSTPFRRSGWHPEMVAGFDQMGPEVAEPMKQTPMYGVYRRVAPRVEDWPILATQLTALLKTVGIADDDQHGHRQRPDLGGGKRDAVWDRSGMTKHALAILPRVTHYDINVAPALATTVASFLDEQ
jgi:pimeloyl-ACP methyl ester carboxylesterase